MRIVRMFPAHLPKMSQRTVVLARSKGISLSSRVSDFRISMRPAPQNLVHLDRCIERLRHLSSFSPEVPASLLAPKGAERPGRGRE